MRGKLVFGTVFLPFLFSITGCTKAEKTAASAEAQPEDRAVASTGKEPAPPPPPAEPAAAPAATLAYDREEAPAKAKADPGGVAVPPAARPARAAKTTTGAAGGLLGPATGESTRSRWAPPAESFAGVKAGEWDDNANYREFTRFLASSHEAFHRVNLHNRRFLVVRDQNGLGIPRCKVTVRDGRQRSTSFLTNASGRAILFPHAEGLDGEKLVANAECAEGRAEASFSAANGEDGLVDLRVQAARRPIGARAIDVAFVLDTTGSMSEEISAVKATIQKVAKVLSNEQTTVRIGLVEYKDRTDPFVTKVYPFSSDLAAFSRKVDSIVASGGGDTPEDMNAGLHAALTDLSWNKEAVARLAFVIADAPPHLDYQTGPSYSVDMKEASHRGIQLFTVAASGMDALGQVVMRQMAQYTGGTNMFVLRGGAGPQSTGGGDPASSCGGTHTNYSSGKLDELIVQKIRRELRALDADPMRVAGLHEDENAKPCDRRIVFRD